MDPALGEARAAAFMEDSFRIGRINHMGAWPLVLLSNINGTELGAQEWRDSLFLSYRIYIPLNC